MFKLLAICEKELKILLRDKPGLAMLFLMPMALVLVITLIQNNILESSKQTEIKLLVLDLDDGKLGKNLMKGVEDSPFFSVVQKLDNKPLTLDKIQALVANGDYQAGMIITNHASEIQVEKVLKILDGGSFHQKEPTVLLIFDPNLQSSMKMTLSSMVKRLIQTEKISTLFAQLKGKMGAIPTLGSGENNLWASADQVIHEHSKEIEDSFVMLHKDQVHPNAVQHNVPGWTMFAIFFISLPLAAGLIRERNDGTLTRLRTMPISIPMLFMGKIITYVVISLIQLLLMLWIGKSILPLFGTPSLDLGHSPFLIILVGLCAALAACGMGMFFGVIAKSYDQVASAGPILIVIAAAIGGIMVPVFMMPDFIQPLSNISPLHWGHEAFIDIFLRGASLADLLPNLFKMISFFVVMTVLSVIIYRKQKL